MAEGEGYGQQRPEDSASEYNAVRFLVKRMIAQLDTLKIVKVTAVDTEAKTVTVLPLVEQIDGENQVTPNAPISGVPYMAWQYGTSAVLADPAVDDIGVLLCCDRDTSAVIASRDSAPPGSQRQYDEADGIYLGGVLNDEPEQYVKFTDTGMELADKNGNALVSSSAGWTFTGNVVFNQNILLAGELQSDSGGLYAGNLHIGGTLTADTEVVGGAAGIKLSAHRHGGVQTGGGQTIGPNNLP